jgi:DNA-binding transcriptional LysR family regulator
MELDQLIAFERVVREGSFSRAAIGLGIGQPAVSSRIQGLEEAVGGTLFSRGRRIRLTTLGESFLPYARRVLEVLREGVQAARLAQTGQRGKIRLGTLGSLAGGLVGPALAKFIRAHPNVDCALKSADHEVLVELLLDGIIELALIAWPCTEAVEAELTPLFVFHEPVLLIAHPKHALGLRRMVTQDEVSRLARPLLRLRWWQTHHPKISALAERTGTAIEVSMETARHLVTHGVGAGFFTRTYIADPLASGTVTEVAVRGLGPIFRDSALVRRSRSAPLSPATAELIQALRSQAELLTTSAKAGSVSGPRQRFRKRTSEPVEEAQHSPLSRYRL